MSIQISSLAREGPVTIPRVALRCEGLVKRFADVTAVNGLDLEVFAGECFGLLGPNGAGKTTTVEILEGLLGPTAGEVEVLGARWDRDAAALRERLGITLQETHLPERLTVELAVACALVGDPELLFLDEPTTGLDPQSRRQLWEVVHGYRAAGRTVLLTTHYMDEAERLCDRVAVVDRGRVIALGTPRELVARHAGSAVVEFAAEGAPGEVELAALPGVRAARRAADGWALTADRVHQAVPALLALLEARGAALLRL